MKIMIVDDNYDNRLILKKILEQHQCIEECDGKQAVGSFVRALHNKEPFDLVLMDIMMPEIDGLSALEIIREVEKKWEIPPGSECKVIMVTALDSPKDVCRAFFKGGATEYIAKPIDKDELRQKIASITESGGSTA
jgi:two-component system chemotaxis response regulator CheY